MRRLRRTISLLLAMGLVLLCGLMLYGYGRRHPEDLPWTRLDLSQPVGAFTGRKLADLADQGPRCRTLLQRAGVHFAAVPMHSAGPQCGYSHAVRFDGGGSLAIRYHPKTPVTSSAVAAALALWEWHVVQPAAQRRFGRPVATIEHYGSYSCRRLYGRAEGEWSEHATANAIDIAGFSLNDGTHVLVERDWNAGGAREAFLKDVRDGACRLFASVLSPDYNEAHGNHLHLDQAARGALGWRVCE